MCDRPVCMLCGDVSPTATWSLRFRLRLCDACFKWLAHGLDPDE